MKSVLIFIIGLLVGIGVHWYATEPKQHTTAINARETPSEPGEIEPGRPMEKEFNRDRIKDELSRTGQVIREKARDAGDSIADATANPRATAAIKTKLLSDTGLAAFKIDVDSNDGVVTLSGTVLSHAEIERAIDIAWETEGVYKVVSTLQIATN